MKAVLSTGSVLAGIALLTGCSERNVTTAPSTGVAALSPAGVIGDRPYTWSLKCSGDFASPATWSWTAAGVPIAGTETSLYCYPSLSPVSGTGVRPAPADGFSACVNYECQTWTFDAAAAFKTHVKGSYSFPDFSDPTCDPFGSHPNHNCYLTATATLTVDS